MLEFIVPATTGETHLLMITPSEIARAKERKYEFMHIGTVQVGIKLLAREGIDCSVLCVLQDNRITDFQKSLLGTLEASLCNQIAYFNYFPNFTTSLRDATHSLRLRVKTNGIAMKENMQELAIVYRVYYKLMSTTVEPKTKISNVPGLTTGFLTNPRNCSEQIKKVTWNEVTFPLEWKLSGPKIKPENTKAKSYQDKKTENISLRFEGHRRSDVNFEEINRSTQNLNLQNLRRSHTVRETPVSSTKPYLDEQEEFELELNRPARMLRSEKLYELYEEAENCENLERLEQLVLKIQNFKIKK